MESTASLFQRIRLGDAEARDLLFARYLPLLTRWASGRLPARARAAFDTDDLVQVSLLRALKKVEAFEPEREGAFLFYLRKTILNQIRDQLRRAAARPQATEDVPDDVADDATSPLEHAVRRELLDRYDESLQTLTEPQREAVVLRIEMGFSYPQIAEALGSASPDAARMLVTRGVARLAEAMAPLNGEGDA